MIVTTFDRADDLIIVQARELPSFVDEIEWESALMRQ